MYFSKFDYKNTYHILGSLINTINKKFQNISFENSSLGKHVFWENDLIKDNGPKCKVNTLACYISFGPLSLNNTKCTKKKYIFLAQVGPTMRNCIHQNHISLQLEIKKQLVYNCCETIIKGAAQVNGNL